MLQLQHQIREPTIRLHQARRRTHKPIRQLAHSAEKAILKDPVRFIHKVGQLDGEAVHTRLVTGDGRDFGNDNGPSVLIVHVLQVANASVAIGTVIMKPDIVGWIGRDEVHEILEPFLPVGIIRHGRADEFLALLISQGHHLIVPGLRRALRGDAVLIRLVEEMDDGLVAVEDVLPIATGQLGFEMDHGAEWGSTVDLGWNPGVPIADGREGAVEVALVHGPWDTRVAGAGAVGPVPEQTALFDYHFQRGIAR